MRVGKGRKDQGGSDLTELSGRDEGKYPLRDPETRQTTTSETSTETQRVIIVMR